eukprot:gene39943-49059_t
MAGRRPQRPRQLATASRRAAPVVGASQWSQAGTALSAAPGSPRKSASATNLLERKHSRGSHLLGAQGAGKSHLKVSASHSNLTPGVPSPSNRTAPYMRSFASCAMSGYDPRTIASSRQCTYSQRPSIAAMSQLEESTCTRSTSALVGVGSAPTAPPQERAQQREQLN